MGFWLAVRASYLKGTQWEGAGRQERQTYHKGCRGMNRNLHLFVTGLFLGHALMGATSLRSRTLQAACAPEMDARQQCHGVVHLNSQQDSSKLCWVFYLQF